MSELDTNGGDVGFFHSLTLTAESRVIFAREAASAQASYRVLVGSWSECGCVSTLVA